MLEVTVKIEGFDEEGNPTASVQDEIIAGVCNQLTAGLERQNRELIQSKLEKIVAERTEAAVNERLGQLLFETNEYGEHRGKQLTLIELIVAAAEKHLKQKVRLRDGAAPSYNDPQAERVVWLAQTMAETTVCKELAPLLEKAKSDAKEFMANKVGIAIKEAMKTAIK